MWLKILKIHLTRNISVKNDNILELEQLYFYSYINHFYLDLLSNSQNQKTQHEESAIRRIPEPRNSVNLHSFCCQNEPRTSEFIRLEVQDGTALLMQLEFCAFSMFTIWNETENMARSLPRTSPKYGPVIHQRPLYCHETGHHDPIGIQHVLWISPKDVPFAFPQCGSEVPE